MKPFATSFILSILILTGLFSICTGQTQWTRYTGNPVLGPGPSGAWDAEFVGLPSILFDGNIYRLWYAGRNSIQRVGYATSPDGIIWTKYDDPTTTGPFFAESDPVLNPGQPGAWDEKQATAPFVLLFDTTYHMWYRGKDNTSNGGPPSIGHATSKDGINWEKDTLNNPVLSPGKAGSWDAGYIGYQSVVFDGTIYHLWYKGWNGKYGIDSHAQIGHATSPHPDSTWSKDPKNPVLRFGSSDSWDYPRVDFPNVIYYDITFHMWYSGGGQFTWRIGYATSPDGSTWTKDAGNPVLDWGVAGSWEDTWVGASSVFFDTTYSIFKMWYTGGNGVWDGHIGYATAPKDPVGIKDYDNTYFPEKYSLSQNYPNPFNPLTKIKFILPKQETVKIELYNTLGQKIETLLNKAMKAGHHEIEFNGSHLSSGIYFYRIEVGDPARRTGEFQDVKKMILLR